MLLGSPVEEFGGGRFRGLLQGAPPDQLAAPLFAQSVLSDICLSEPVLSRSLSLDDPAQGGLSIGRSPDALLLQVRRRDPQVAQARTEAPQHGGAPFGRDSTDGGRTRAAATRGCLCRCGGGRGGRGCCGGGRSEPRRCCCGGGGCFRPREPRRGGCLRADRHGRGNGRNRDGSRDGSHRGRRGGGRLRSPHGRGDGSHGTTGQETRGDGTPASRGHHRSGHVQPGGLPRRGGRRRRCRHRGGSSIRCCFFRWCR
mmetsp:Transcript_8656/g.25611  ORF Transcript_8656/g.25611 Transcript_8656/m.25611 type:complete len:255 (-) Transcript_8656:37-801(-)